MGKGVVFLGSISLWVCVRVCEWLFCFLDCFCFWTVCVRWQYLFRENRCWRCMRVHGWVSFSFCFSPFFFFIIIIVMIIMALYLSACITISVFFFLFDASSDRYLHIYMYPSYIHQSPKSLLFPACWHQRTGILCNSARVFSTYSFLLLLLFYSCRMASSCFAFFFVVSCCSLRIYYYYYYFFFFTISDLMQTFCSGYLRQT